MVSRAKPRSGRDARHERDALTIRFPSAVLFRARSAKPPDISFNEFVVAAVDREARRRTALATVKAIEELVAKMAARTGVQSDSTPLIRALREGRGRR